MYSKLKLYFVLSIAAITAVSASAQQSNPEFPFNSLVVQPPVAEESTGRDLQKELDQVRTLLDIQQQQLDALKRLSEASAEQLTTPLAGNAIDGSQEDIERLKAAGLQAAQRDQEIEYQLDRLIEEVDSLDRNGSQLPATLREVFLPSRYDQSPIVMYNTLQAGFTDIGEENSNFGAPTWLPHFYMTFQEKYQLQINPQINAESFELLSGQMDWFATDHLTFSFGRFYSPLGFFNERLHTSWVLKTPDDPLVFEVIYPHQLSMNGIQARGATYLGDLPVKLEYTGFCSNGFSLTPENPTAQQYADFRLMRKSFLDVNNDKAFGGRLGLFFPYLGLVVGASGLLNGAYDVAGENDLSLVDFDASYHAGNWDLKFEYVRVSQQAPTGHINRQGFYFQSAYRNYDSIHPFFGNLEYLFRFGHVDFDGIDLAVTGLTFGAPDHTPINRNRYTLGTNYYFSPSLIAKVAYEFNDELEFTEIDDNGILAQVSWGF
ncbi:MAG: hypothetical protein KDB03_17020 [Planctomycetales bacterium]|nr:hypothetical protein [Planctomycetales bacterium]